ncbi:MAG: D-sedoheptulose-7-phosphate isomerase [Marmoricola sp.]
MNEGPDDTGADSLESLYPFLYAEGGDLDAVLQQVRESTVEKALEIVALRERMREEYADRLVSCAREMAERFAAGGWLYSFGNGGSATDAQAATTAFADPADGRAPLPGIALANDVAVLTALSNDVGFDVVFSRQLDAFGHRDDIALGISTSGNSANVLRAFEVANRKGMLTIGMAGYEGGRMAESDDVAHMFVVPSASVHRIQEAQTTLYHVLRDLAHEAMSVHA